MVGFGLDTQRVIFYEKILCLGNVKNKHSESTSNHENDMYMYTVYYYI